MRAICLLKMLLMVGLAADVGTAFAIEEMAQSRPQALVHGRQLQDRHFENRKSAAAGPIRTAGAKEVLSATASQRLSATANQRLSATANQTSSADLFAMDRSAAFALPLSATSRFASKNIEAGLNDGFTAADQQRNIAALRRQIDAARMHSAGDVWLMTLVGLMLVAYQLCRKHRFLRPKPFAL